MVKECGDFTCKKFEYCRSTDHICHSCSSICNPGLNNYDRNRCSTDCQDYLQDQMNSGNNARIESELWTLKLLLIVTLVLTVVTLSVLFIIFFMKLKRWKHHKKKSSATLPSVIYNNKCEKRLRQQPSIQQRKNENNNTGGSMSSRQPSESTLPEYSYDNPALAPSPTNHI